MRNALGKEKVVTGTGDTPLDALVEQLWRQPVNAGQVRVVTDAAAEGQGSGWEDVERYWVLPSLSAARLLIPRGHRRVTSAALRSYRNLRTPKVRLARNILGLVARTGLPASLHTLSVQRPAGSGSGRGERLMTGSCLPLHEIALKLGRGPLAAAIGIRLGDNRKPTLQLFDTEGRPAGYAKLAWNGISAEFIRTEAAMLRDVSLGAGPARVPDLLTTGEWNGFPYLVTAPLPDDVRAVRGNVGRPTPREILALAPVERAGTVASTRHFKELTKRLNSLPDAHENPLRSSTEQTERLVRSRNSTVPISRRWHGDLVPWNAAREPDGQFWCWDWESGEPDVVAGLDALHWAMSVRREAGTGTATGNLLDSLADSRIYLHAAGFPMAAEADLAAVYALVVAERAWTLAVHNDGWSSSWISKEEILRLLAAARALMN